MAAWGAGAAAGDAGDGISRLAVAVRPEHLDRRIRPAHARAWVDRGRTVAIEYRWAEGRGERFAEIAAEFVRLKVDVIVTAGTDAVIAVKKATSTFPSSSVRRGTRLPMG